MMFWGKVILAYLATGFLFYLIGVFVSVELNIFNWDKASRVFIAGISMITPLIMIIEEKAI